MFSIDISTIFQIGPGIVNLTFDSVFGRGAYLQALTPIEPITQRMIHNVYFKKSTPTIIGKFFLLAEAMMVRSSTYVSSENGTHCHRPSIIGSFA